MTPIEQLSKKLREAREKATSGEWLEGEIMFGDTGEYATMGTPHHKLMPDMLMLKDVDFCVLAANNITRILDELDRLIEVEKVLKAMCGDLRDKFDELRWEEYLSGKGSNILHNTVDEYLERADEIGKGQDEKA